ncbi:cytosolic non-specific dipeptidase-like isoform X2 [Xenia sp. Carnegie-2017]|uniref:cytosolic non-specific dipeptidase-like isoform X2 n=1 Tax=Xenia sp. Carnegie-2017 TaxID=2897299 RepID=UPI001F042979|nr:cytosolic non-specific dipeptidase-like isoform X2 [Xenia sp. Carnegie-2017]
MAGVSLDAVNQYIDEHMSNFKEGLRNAVAIKSVSSNRDHRGDVIRMMETAASRMENSLGMSVELRDLGLDPNYPDGDVQLPPVILASLGNDPNKKTLCIYGHLDVQPAEMSDGWNHPPFELTIVDDEMFGRGSTDDKGPVLGWLNSIEAFQQTNTSIPLNLKFVLEGMEESGSVGLADLIKEEKDLFFKDVDFIAISDNYWLGTSKPCLTYGLRGIIYFHVKVNCADKDLHSGSHGGPVYEAMSDVVALLSTLTDEKGKILIPGVNDSVRELTPEEEALYDDLDFDMNVYREQLGAHELTTSNEKNTLMRRWRYPSLSIHGFEGAFSGPGDKTVIPYEVIGKFSIRLVPDQDPEVIGQLVIDHLNYVHRQRGSPNIMTPTYSNGASRAWLGDFENPVFEAGKLATLDVHSVEPDCIREGGSLPLVLTLTETTGKDCVFLPMGRSDDCAHSQNEKLNITNLQAGVSLMCEDEAVCCLYQSSWCVD